jgi:hypothetical protein
MAKTHRPLHLGYFLLQRTPERKSQNYIHPHQNSVWMRVDVLCRGPVLASAQLEAEGMLGVFLQMWAAREVRCQQHAGCSHTEWAPWHIECVHPPRTFPIVSHVALYNHPYRCKLDPLLCGHECIIVAAHLVFQWSSCPPLSANQSIVRHSGILPLRCVELFVMPVNWRCPNDVPVPSVLVVVLVPLGSWWQPGMHG